MHRHCGFSYILPRLQDRKILVSQRKMYSKSKVSSSQHLSSPRLREKKVILLEEACIFGNGQIANFLLNQAKSEKLCKNEDYTKPVMQKALRNSIMSDNVYCCKIVKEHCEKIGVDSNRFSLSH